MQDFELIQFIEALRSRIPATEFPERRFVLTCYKTAQPWEMMSALAQVITGLDDSKPDDARRLSAWINRAHGAVLSSVPRAVRPPSWIINEPETGGLPPLPDPDEYQARALRYLSLEAFYAMEDGRTPAAAGTARPRIPTRFGQELDECSSVEEAIALARKRLPRLRVLDACRYLMAVGYPIALPLPDVVRFCGQFKFAGQRSGDAADERSAAPASSSSVSAAVADAVWLTAFLQRASRLTCLSIPHISWLLGVYSGALKMEGRRPICPRLRPLCEECDLTQVCSRYQREGAVGVAGPAVERARERISIKDWSVDERPRERLLAGERLSNAELLGVILRTGTGSLSAVELGRALLSEFEDLHALQKATPGEIMNRMRGRGIGPAKAAEICAAIELGRRVTQPAADTRSGRRRLTSSRDIFEIFRARYKAATQEEFLLLILDTKNRIQKEEVISIGTLNSSLAHPRDIFRVALREAAFAVIFVHNHPSGDPTPSDADFALTARLVDAGKLLGIQVLDHVIIGSHEWYSFADHGRLA